MCYNKPMIWFFLFLFGIIFGSFLNVVSLRYDGDHFVLDPRVIGGRSHCPSCKRTLRWFELVPVASFFIQRGRCRTCKARLSFQYPLVELISGLIFVLVPWRLAAIGAFGWVLPVLSALWIFAFLALLVMAIIDVRLGIIPDELSIAIGVAGAAIGILLALAPAAASGSFLGPLGDAFSVGNAWAGRVIAAAGAFIFFEFLVLVTREKGIGMGDVKLALALGILFGWPDVAGVIGFAFVCGALIGVFLIAGKRKTMGGTLPFGPFLAASAAFIFLFGAPVARWYLGLMGF